MTADRIAPGCLGGATWAPHACELAEEFALFTTLSDYPRESSFDEVIAELETRAKGFVPFDEALSPQRQFEFYTATEVIEHLQNMRLMALQQFGSEVEFTASVAQCAEDNPQTNATLQDFISTARIITGIEPSPEDIAEAEANAPKY